MWEIASRVHDFGSHLSDVSLIVDSVHKKSSHSCPKRVHIVVPNVSRQFDQMLKLDRTESKSHVSDDAQMADSTHMVDQIVCEGVRG